MSSPSALALRFQFETAEQQKRVATVGMWVFLATEILMFGALFTTYSVYRLYYTHAFAVGSNLNNVTAGALNTAILLTSSLTMALAVWSAKTGRTNLLLLFLALTMVIGAIFLGIKFWEYYEHYVDAKIPGFNFRYEGAGGNHVAMFFMFYFIMTGLHAVHMIVGLGILTVIWFRALLGTFSPAYHTPVEITGLYWHFVDVIWIFLFPLFYLVDRHLH